MTVPANPRDAARVLGHMTMAALLDNAPVKPNTNTFLSSLLLADPDSILQRFEAHARRASAAVGVNLSRLIKPGRLMGDEGAFHDAFAELVALSWFSGIGVLEAPKQLVGSDTLSGKAHELDGALSAGGSRSKQVLFDVKCLRSQARQHVDSIEEEISRKLAQAGVVGTVSIQVKGSLDAARITNKDKASVIAEGIAQLPTTPPGQEIELGEFAGCRLTAQFRAKSPYRTVFQSGIVQVEVERKELWQKLKQLPRSRPFLLVLVRTYAGGLKHVGMVEILEHVLRGHTDELRDHAIFGHATGDLHGEPAIPRRDLQRHLSGVCFIDDENSTFRLFTNPYALYPLPRSLKTRLNQLKPPSP